MKTFGEILEAKKPVDLSEVEKLASYCLSERTNN